MMNSRQVIQWDEGWNALLKGITKLKMILEGDNNELQFTSAEYMSLYTTVYQMCTQNPDYSQELYDHYKLVFVDYIQLTVLPALRDKQNDQFLLKEFVKRWTNHKIMIRWMSRFFNYLSRSFITKKSLPTLVEVGLKCFHDLVYQEFHGKAKDTILALIHVEREGGQIDRALVKNVLDIFIELGIEHYVNDFEKHMLEDTATYYSRKSSEWIVVDSSTEYKSKYEESLKKETDRVDHYLHCDTEEKLLKTVKSEFNI